MNLYSLFISIASIMVFLGSDQVYGSNLRPSTSTRDVTPEHSLKCRRCCDEEDGTTNLTLNQLSSLLKNIRLENSKLVMICSKITIMGGLQKDMRVTLAATDTVTVHIPRMRAFLHVVVTSIQALHTGLAPIQRIAR
jgi:hypothetical protein